MVYGAAGEAGGHNIFLEGDIAMKYTASHHLPSWDKSDRIRMEDFNDMTARLETSLTAGQKAVSDEQKVRQTAIAAEQQARQTAIAAEQQARQTAIAAERKAMQDAVAAERQARENADARMDQLGNCRIYHHVYSGTGSGSTIVPVTHTFPGKPLMLFVSEIGSGFAMFAPYGVTMADAGLTNGVRSIVSMTWNGNTVRWSGSQQTGNQLNNQGRQYQIVALIAADA